MTGYEKSPDYGSGGRQPDGLRWAAVAVAIFVLAMIAGAVF